MIRERQKRGLKIPKNRIRGGGGARVTNQFRIKVIGRRNKGYEKKGELRGSSGGEALESGDGRHKDLYGE